MSVVYPSANQELAHAAVLPQPATGAPGKGSLKSRKVTVRDTDDPEEVRKFLNSKIPYRNMAGNPDVDQRVLAFVTARKQEFETKTEGVRKLWRLMAHTMRGNSLANVWGLPAQHVPLLYNRRETLVPRVEEALWQYDPFFRLRGRDQMDRDRAERMTEFIRAELSEVGEQYLRQPSIRSLYDYSVAIFYWWWDYREDWGEEQKSEEKQDKNGLRYWEQTYTPKLKVSRNRVNCCLVEPFRFFIDPSSTDVNEASYCGHRSEEERSQLLFQCQIGTFANEEALTALAPSEDNSRAEYDRRQSSPTERNWNTTKAPNGAPQPLKVETWWCRFDLYNEGRERECKLVVAEDKVVLQAIENYLPDKIRPYGVARAVEESFEFYGRGPMDNGLHIQQQADIQRTLHIEAMKGSACPIATTERDGLDLPATLMNALPFTVYQGVGELTWMKLPDVLAEFVGFREVIESDMDNATGAPKGYQGAAPEGGGDTATAYQGSLNEANKRTLGPIRGLSRCWVQNLRVVTAYYKLFLTERRLFRVLGKASKGLASAESYVDPRDFDYGADYEIVGPAQLHTMGQRAAALVQFQSIMGPTLQMHGDKVNQLALAKKLYELTVGREIDDDIIEAPKNLSQLWTPQQENWKLDQGLFVEVDEQDIHEDHIPEHVEAYEKAKKRGASQQVLAAYAQHILHQVLAKMDQERREKQSMARTPSVAQGPMANAQTSMNQSPPAQEDDGSLSADPQVTPSRQLPGNNAGERTARPGRRTSVPQEQGAVGAR